MRILPSQLTKMIRRMFYDRDIADKEPEHKFSISASGASSKDMSSLRALFEYWESGKGKEELENIANQKEGS